MPEPTIVEQSGATNARPLEVDFATIAAMFDDDEEPAPVCDLENPESCESCQ